MYCEKRHQNKIRNIISINSFSISFKEKLREAGDDILLIKIMQCVYFHSQDN